MEARFKKSGWTVFSRGPKGTARVADDGVLLAYDDGTSARVRFGDLRKVGFNPRNGLWTFHPKEGRKLHIQTTGTFFSIGDRAEGRRFNEALGLAAARRGVKVVSA